MLSGLMSLGKCQRLDVHLAVLHLPMDEAQLVDGFYCQRDFCHVKSSDVLREDLILDEHSHQVATRQELHEHV